MTADANTPRDVLIRAINARSAGLSHPQAVERANCYLRDIAGAGYQITPIRADDGARVEAAARVLEAMKGIIDTTDYPEWVAARKLSSIRDLILGPLDTAVCDLITAADAVAGAGRDAEARDAARYRWLKSHKTRTYRSFLGIRFPYFEIYMLGKGDDPDAAIDAELPPAQGVTVAPVF